MVTRICPGSANELPGECQPGETTLLAPPTAVAAPILTERPAELLNFADTAMTRRRIAVVISMTLGFFSFGRIPLAAGQLPAEAPRGTPLTDTEFLALSRALTGHRDLHPRTAGRMLAAFQRTDAAVYAALPALSRLPRDGQSATELSRSAQAAGLGDAALAVVTAWYTGTVGSGAKVEVVAYAEALMYWPVRDAMPPPSYVLGGPAWWVAPPPPVGVSGPPRAAGGTP